MRAFIVIIAALILIPPVAMAHEAGMDVSPSSIEKGKSVFMAACNACHGLKFYRDTDHPSGYAPGLDPRTAKESFGVEPPDLSLMASARGKRKNGARYIFRLLTTYYIDQNGNAKNRAFGEETQGDGAIAMPQPIPSDDPELKQKAMDVAAFLYAVGDPSRDERRQIGKYVLVYMAVITALLFALNKVTWKGVKKKLY